jgi:hypothetical protein
MGEWMYRSTFPWPRHYFQVSVQLHAPAALLPGKEPAVPIGQEAGYTPEPVWMTWRSGNSCLHRDSNFDPLIIQPLASRYPGTWEGECIHEIFATPPTATRCKNPKSQIDIRIETGYAVSMWQLPRPVPRYEQRVNCHSHHTRVTELTNKQTKEWTQLREYNRYYEPDTRAANSKQLFWGIITG